jgi:arylsulfatase A-like enzyme
VHGVNDSPDNFWAGRAKSLAPTIPYLAELLARDGYETAGVVSSVPMSPRYGFERGFDVYRVHAAKAEDVVDSALDLVTHAGERPFFLFVHFIDPHWPYLPMVDFRSYAEAFIQRFGRRPSDISGLIRRQQGKALKALPTDADDVRTLYDAAVAYVDQELGRFFAELKKRKIYEDAFILLTGDHGEAFFDHETYGHAKTLYQELTHVPLVVKWPGNAPTGRIDTPVSHVDIFPTVLAAAGLPPPPTEGTDLRSPPADRALVLDASWEDGFRRETMLAVRRGPYKYIAYLPFEPFGELSLQAVLREELYDLSSDPNESENMIEHPPVPLAPFRQRLKAYMDVARVYRAQHEGTSISIDDDVRRSLEALGYVSP